LFSQVDIFFLFFIFYFIEAGAEKDTKKFLTNVYGMLNLPIGCTLMVFFVWGNVWLFYFTPETTFSNGGTNTSVPSGLSDIGRSGVINDDGTNLATNCQWLSLNGYWIFFVSWILAAVGCCCVLISRLIYCYGQRKIPKGWTQAIDPSTKRTYYFNRSTQQTSWTFPVAASGGASVEKHQQKNDSDSDTALQKRIQARVAEEARLAEIARRAEIARQAEFLILAFNGGPSSIKAAGEEKEAAVSNIFF